MSANQLDPRWNQVSTYSDLLKLGEEFVTGKLTCTPHYSRPLIMESSDLPNKLFELHKYGLYTVDGQEPRSYYNFYGPSNDVTSRNEEGKEWVDEEQRGYLCFYVDLEENALLAHSLSQQVRDSKLYYSYCNFSTNEATTNIYEEEGCINVTRLRSSKTKEDLSTSKWENYTNLWAILKPEDLLVEAYNPITFRILKKTVNFRIALPEYCKGDLETQLIKMCEKARGKVY